MTTETADISEEEEDVHNRWFETIEKGEYKLLTFLILCDRKNLRNSEYE